GSSSLDLVKKDLSFYHPDLKKFPSLSLAYDVLKKGHNYCVALNASNEITVDAFLKNKINFVDIYKNNSEIINKINKVELNNISEIIEYDFEIKELTKEILKKNS
ncbi:MAG: hypothetical protein VW452_05015, partial [Pelagibacteraceae bacterium]